MSPSSPASTAKQAQLVKVLHVGAEVGAATAATHRCLWGALAAAVAWPTLGACGVAHAELGAAAVGLLTV
ncbi:hypothetical protein AB0M46_29130, partial [Dactylosporangium sp. NPDC051485]|uniref:hypothetical protein n=1 Tax=Dactylosporangium sp. NPDC051485 TaxID=3154846 RepID=UPI0034383536